MKILHTSDWHLGKKLYEIDFEQHHRLFLQWLLDVVEEKQIEVLIIAGDIFDQAHPSKAAERLYYDFLKQLFHSSCKHVIVTGGNHDSPATLEAPKDILEIVNVTCIGAVGPEIQDQIIELRNDNDEIDLVIAAVPFLRDRDIRKALAGESYDEKVLQIKEGITKYYSDLGDYCKDNYHDDIPIIATGHLFVSGVSSDAESVRDIQLGNLAGMEASMFHPRFNYIALGHIHMPQEIKAPMPVRYSGAPIALSFSERNYKHSIAFLDLSSNHFDLELLSVPHFRELISLKGSFEDIQTKLLELKGDPELPTLIELMIEEETYDLAILPQIESLIENVNKECKKNGVYVARKRIRFATETKGADELFDEPVDIDTLTVEDIFMRKLEEEEVPDNTRDQLLLAFKEVQESLNQEDKNEDTGN